MTTKVALGAVVMRIPAVTDLDQDPLELETGDWVKVDAGRGIVEIDVGRRVHFTCSWSSRRPV
jgi:hypothetical protein